MYDTGIRADPDNPLFWGYRGRVLVALERYAEALQSFDRALVLDPMHSFAARDKGDLLLAAGRHADALSAYTQALAADPENTELSLIKANLEKNLKR